MAEKISRTCIKYRINFFRITKFFKILCLVITDYNIIIIITEDFYIHVLKYCSIIEQGQLCSFVIIRIYFFIVIVNKSRKMTLIVNVSTIM